MKKVLILLFATVLSIAAISFRPIFVGKENLVINVENKLVDSKFSVTTTNHIFIPPAASSYMPQEVPAMGYLEVCFMVGDGVENVQQKSISSNYKKILHDIDMRSLDK